ncbi:MAG: hypothetical protein ACTJHU_00400 [Mycetocola sp.]
MSAHTVSATPSAARAVTQPGRIGRIVRLHLLTPSTFIGIPWLILVTAFGVSLVIAAWVSAASGAEVDEGMRYSWAVLSPQWYLAVVGVQSIGLTFQFALGFGTTRRDFWIGTSVLFVGLAAVNALAYAALTRIEIATNGWGIGAHMFDALWYGLGPWYQDAYTAFVMQLFVLFLGATAAAVYMRWRARGMLIATGGVLALLLAFGTVLTLNNAWGDVLVWGADVGISGIFTVVLAITVALALAGYRVLSRATPRS